MTARARRGHVYRRPAKNGGWSRWHAVIDVEPGGDGRRRQATRSFDTRHEAYAWLSNRAAKEVAGPTVAQYLRAWLGRQGHLRASTRASYRGHIDTYLVQHLGQVALTQLGAVDVQGLHAALSAAGVSTELGRRIHATLSSALSAAVREGLIASNPATQVRLPRGHRRRATVWTAEQAGHFLACTRRDDLAALWRMALVCGLRRGELLGLRWRDLEMGSGTLTVHTTRVAVGAQVVEGPPKSRRSRRVLPLDATTLGMLSQHRHRQIGQTPASWSLGQHLFTDAYGDPLSPGWVSRRFTELIETAGLPRIRFHDLRHTSATLGLAAGESLKEVSARLGHSSIVVTADTYLTPPDHLARESTQRLASTLDRADDNGVEGAA